VSGAFHYGPRRRHRSQSDSGSGDSGRHDARAGRANPAAAMGRRQLPAPGQGARQGARSAGRAGA
jgi:hypothetical protein